jgi:ribonuclease G
LATDILISSDPWENRVAILEDGALAEIHLEREEKVIGSIYKGKVQNVLVALGASFVDIGLGRNAFLYVDDINKTPLNIGDVEITQGRSGWTITEKVNRGDDVLVQIVKEPRGLKGARVSTNITLPGRYLILMPTGKYSGVSRKIESAEERNRLKALMKMIRPEGMATVVRTAAAGVSQAELIADLGVLIRMWHGILETYKRATAPALIHKDMNLVFKAARDFITPEVDRVLIDDAEEFEKVRDFMRLLGPQYVDRISHYNHGHALFKDYKIDDELQKLLKPKINLSSGGSIVIETTEALTVIDVNSGKSTSGKNLEDTIVKTNVEAAAEIARQVRLRDIGGIIVCDFIDMNSESSRNKVIATLEAGLRKDRTRTTIQSFSALGLLEFTRKRVGKDLAGQLRGSCPTCVGQGTVLSPETVAIGAFRELRSFGHTHSHSNGRAGSGKEGEPTSIQVHAAPTVGAQLEYWYEDEMASLEKELGTHVEVVVDPAMHPEKTTVTLAPAGHDGKKGAVDGIRVGDEVDVDLLPAKLPDPTSAVAVVGNRLVEVKDAAGAAGQSLRIKIIDIDEEGNILAEPRTVVAQAVGEGRRRRRRGGRGRRKPLTAAEQAQELRELAEEAAKGLGGRTAAIGISTVDDAEQEAAATPHADGLPIAVVVPPGAQASYFGDTAQNGEGGDGRRRRRRRRRRRGGAAGDASSLAGIPPRSAALQTFEEDVAVESPVVAAAVVPTPAASPQQEENGGRRRRRRRRRRGRGEPFVAAGTAGTVPDRHIFRVDGAGGAEATGASAPPEPQRAIARRSETVGKVAVEAPPPSLKIAEAPPKAARPSRRTRPIAGPKKPAEIASAPRAALPAAAGDESPKPRSRTRTASAAGAVVTVKVVAEAPKRRTRKAAGEGAAEKPAPKPRAAAKAKPAAKSAAKSTASAKKTPARKASGTAKKTSTRKKSS